MRELDPDTAPTTVRVMDVGSLHDGLGRSYSPGRLVIEGERIIAVGHPDDGQIAAILEPLTLKHGPAQSLSFPAATAVPGLIDTHVHLTLGTGLRTYEDVMAQDDDGLMLLRAAENARRHLRSGVTTVCDLGCRGRTTFVLREAVRGGVLPDLPELVLCGRPITAPRGHFWFCGEEAAGGTEIRTSVDRLVCEGADVIKIMATGGGSAGTDRSAAYYAADELLAGVLEAREHSLPVIVHAQGTPGIRNAVEAGVDTIAHCDFLDPAGRPGFDAQLADRIAQASIYVDPTLHVYKISIELLIDLAETRSLTAAEQARLDSFQARYEAGIARVARLHARGVRLIGGSDAIRRYGDYYLTFEIFLDCGLSAEEALAAMTSVAAQSLDKGHLVGSLAPGLLADVLVLEGDPFYDRLALRRVHRVFRRGKPVADSW